MSLEFSAATDVVLSDIDTDTITQTRAEFDESAVDDYARDMEAGQAGEFPAVMLLRHEAKYLVLDGFHRVAAARKASLDTIRARVADGLLEEGQEWAFANANRTHGVRRTNKDKRRHAEWILDRAFGESVDGEVRITNSELGRRVKIDHKTAKRYREAWEKKLEVSMRLPERLTEGHTYWVSADDGKFGCRFEFGYVRDDRWLVAMIQTEGLIDEIEGFAPQVAFFNEGFCFPTAEDWRLVIPSQWPITEFTDFHDGGVVHATEANYSAFIQRKHEWAIRRDLDWAKRQNEMVVFPPETEPA